MNTLKIYIIQLNTLKGYLSLILFMLFAININTAFAQKKQKKVSKQEIIDTIYLNTSQSETVFQLTFLKGEGHNHPTFAIWLEDMEGNLIETLFVTQYFATGIFGYADAGNGSWETDAGEAIRPAALPYWTHKRNIISRDSIYAPTPENPLPDAISGATPVGSFVLNTAITKKLPNQYRILMEINQTWDWNEYWTNNKYPDDKNYKSSAQPSIIYEATISLENDETYYQLQAIGHGHYSGKNGELYNDISTLTSALGIAEEIQVTILNQN